jgi:anti-sigma B factor antagonist
VAAEGGVGDAAALRKVWQACRYNTKDCMPISYRDVREGVAAINLSGPMTIGSTDEAIEGLVDILLRQGKKTIIFDVADVTSLDSTGVGHLIASYNKIASAGGDMRIAGATGRVLSTFQISRLDTVFPFYLTVRDAAENP